MNMKKSLQMNYVMWCLINIDFYILNMSAFISDYNLISLNAKNSLINFEIVTWLRLGYPSLSSNSFMILACVVCLTLIIIY